jgi:hypothetical protein
MLRVLKSANLPETVMARLLESHFFDGETLTVRSFDGAPTITVEDYLKICVLQLETDCDFNIKYVGDKKFDQVQNSATPNHKKTNKQIGQDNLGNVFTISKNNVESLDYLKNKYSECISRKIEDFSGEKINLALFGNLDIANEDNKLNFNQYMSLIRDYLDKLNDVYILVDDDDLKLYRVNKNFVEYIDIDLDEFDEIYYSTAQKFNQENSN